MNLNLNFLIILFLVRNEKYGTLSIYYFLPVLVRNFFLALLYTPLIGPIFENGKD